MSKQTFIEKLTSRRANRKGEENVFLNLTSSLYRERKFVHILVSQRLSEIWTAKIISQYIVFLVTCWETFFRDVFVFLLKRYPNLADELKQNAKVKKILGHAPVNLLDQEEYIASIFNFQNLESLQDAFAPILGIHGNLELPAKENVFIHVKQKGWLPFDFLALFPNWIGDLDFTLQERHRIIHDANHSCTVSRKDIQRIESVLFFYLQLFGIFVSNRFQLPWIKFDITISYLKVVAATDHNLKDILISFDDLLSDDWEVLD